MTVRTRKLIGTFALLIILTVYAILAMMIAIILQVNASKTLELLYYVVAGLAWVVPAGLIIQWMLKTKDKSQDRLNLHHCKQGQKEYLEKKLD